MRTRDNKITVYMNDQELARLNALVDKTNLNREQFIRTRVEGLTIKEAPPAPRWQTVCMMKQAAKDMKEIADHSYFSEVSDEVLLRKTIKDIQTCVEEVTKLCFYEEREVNRNENRTHRPGPDWIR